MFLLTTENDKTSSLKSLNSLNIFFLMTRQEGIEIDFFNVEIGKILTGNFHQNFKNFTPNFQSVDVNLEKIIVFKNFQNILFVFFYE